MKKSRIFDVILLVLTLCLTLGVKFVFHACGPKEDGSYMACHWAENAVCALGAVQVCIAVLLFVLKGRAKSGAAAALVPAAAVTALVPQFVIRLCMMTEMHCHAVMRPAVILVSAAIAVCAVIAAVLHHKEEA